MYRIDGSDYKCGKKCCVCYNSKEKFTCLANYETQSKNRSSNYTELPTHKKHKYKYKYK